MRVIVIGAGRGKRLMPTTADAPMLCRSSGQAAARLGARRLSRRTASTSVCFIGGYQIDKVQARLSAVRVPPQSPTGSTTTSWRRCSTPRT